MAKIPISLFRQIAERANDPMRRTYMASTLAQAQPLDLNAARADFARHGAPPAGGLLGALDNLQKMMGGMPQATMMGPGGVTSIGSEPAGPQPLTATPSEEAVDNAGSTVGRPLPDEVQQLYGIGDGGFGPGGGLLPLADVIDRYEDLTREPYGPKDQDWPKGLLPLFEEDPMLICIDMDSGEVLAWDPDEIEDEGSDAQWQHSFKPLASSLAAYMEQWLGSQTFEEENAPGSPARVRPQYAPSEDPAENAIRHFAAMSNEERSAVGLPDVGWEDEVRRRHGG